MSKFTLAIMGATGHIGHHLVVDLLKKGHTVRAVGRDAAKLKDLKTKGAHIFAGDTTDASLLTDIFTGCDAVFSFLPPGYSESDMIVFREKTGDAIVHAIKHANISHVVNLSSIGANLASGTGPIKELHHQEERLNCLDKVNILHFRPAFFMENLIMMIPSIKHTGMMVGALRSDLAIPMVSTTDIAEKLTGFFDTLKFKGISTFEFGGPEDISMAQAAKILGTAIGHPHLHYTQIPYREAEKNIVESGVKHQLAHALVEMYKSFNEGLIVPTKRLTAEHRGKTNLQTFSKFFTQIYNSMKKVA
jgi:uncharacterized protein YbjT (DUF2867 family)